MHFEPDEIRMLTAYAPLMLKQLERRQRIILDKIYAKFLVEETDYLALIAQYVTVREQITEINQALRAQGVANGKSATNGTRSAT